MNTSFVIVCGPIFRVKELAVWLMEDVGKGNYEWNTFSETTFRNELYFRYEEDLIIAKLKFGL